MTERLLALVVVAASGAYLLSAWPLPAGTTARPGAGFFPLAVGAFGALMALVWTVSAVRLRWLGAGWGSALVIGLASAAISCYLFGVVLSVPLPRGILFD